MHFHSKNKRQGGRPLDKREFSLFRHQLGKTQKQMAQLLGASVKAIHSYEQGWRRVPGHVERQVLFLASLRRGPERAMGPCWVVKGCSEDKRKDCPAWEFRSGTLCWFINGTLCGGKMQRTWQEKMKTCKSCEILNDLFTFRGRKGHLHQEQNGEIQIEEREIP